MLYYIQWEKERVSEGASLIYDKKQNICIYSESPSEEEIKRISKDFGINEEFFTRYKRELRTVRYSVDPFIFVMIDYYAKEKRVHKSNLFFMIKDKCLIIISPEKNEYYKELFLGLKEKIKTDATLTIPHLFYEFIREDVRENYDVIDIVENYIMDIEDKAIKEVGNPKVLIKKIIVLKRLTLKLSKRFWASARLISTIKKGLTSLTIELETSRLFDDVYDTYIHQLDILNTDKEMLTDILTIYTTNINNKLSETSNSLNIIMKKLTSLTLILMVPTFIASVYGMNFRIMPELNHPLGYLYAIILMFIAAGFTYYFFHKKDWI